MAKPKARDVGQQGKPAGERKAGPELQAAHEAANLSAQKAVIRKGFKDLYDIDQRMDAAIVKHIEPIRQERRDTWKKLKSDTDIDREDMDLAYKLWKREREAADFEEADARDRVQDNLRTIFAALREGEQLGFLDIDGLRTDGKREKGANGVHDVSAYREGQVAHGLGLAFDACPHGDSVNKDAWERGWHNAHDAWEKNAQPAAPAAPAEPPAAH